MMTGDRCYARLQPYLPAAVSMFMVSSANMAHDIAVGTARGEYLSELLRQRVIEGSVEHKFDYWVNNPELGQLLADADEELVDAIVYFALWYMHRGRTI